MGHWGRYWFNLSPSKSKIVWDTWRLLPPYLVGSGGGLGGNRTVTRRQSGVSNRLQRALHRVSRATTPTPTPPSRQPFGIWQIQSTETEKYGLENQRNKVWLGSLSSCREPCIASAAGQQPPLPFFSFPPNFLYFPSSSPHIASLNIFWLSYWKGSQHDNATKDNSSRVLHDPAWV